MKHRFHKVHAYGLMFYRRCFFCSTPNLRGPSADRHETLLHHRNLALLYNPSPKIQGALPQKILGAKNMQNFGRFFATSEFDCEYLRNGLRYPNRNSKFFYNDSSRVLGNKSRELWSTNFPDLDVSLDPLKCTFWAYYISALRGCCTLKFLHTLQIDQGSPKKF